MGHNEARSDANRTELGDGGVSFQRQESTIGGAAELGAWV